MHGRLLEKHDGKIPHDRAALEALPGVGRKTANIILNMVFGEATIAVDTHIFRVANRTGLPRGRRRAKLRRRFLPIPRAVPQRRAPLAAAARALRLHGAQARLPNCIIEDLCEYTHKTARTLDILSGRQVTTACQFASTLLDNLTTNPHASDSFQRAIRGL